MLRYFAGRAWQIVPTLFVIVTLSFFLMRAAPGGPFDHERALPPAIEAKVKAAYDLDKPLLVQYGIYLGDIVRGDFGPSFAYKDFSVSELLAKGFPVSMKLGLAAILTALVCGVTLGTIAALRQNSLIDGLVTTLAMTGVIVPSFVVGPVLALIFAIGLGLLPVAGWGKGVAYMVLPVTALALPHIASISRLTRGSLIEVLRSNFIRTARAKGLPPHEVVLKHALRPALLPVISYLGPATAGIVTGSVVVETIFNIPGVGRYFADAALNRDYTLAMATVILFAALILCANLIVDLIYYVVDPRVAHD